jgi:hypothetical protein
MKLWIKHPRTGKEDTMLTLAVISVLTVLGKFIINGIEVGDVNLGSIDAGLVAALLTPTLGAYVARKYSDSPDKKVKAPAKKK